uniref:Uncharacterized protein n=1 Tax=Anguilla anguilla TaxID=7936 RepID=A0A0E9VBM5_ANGAN
MDHLSLQTNTVASGQSKQCLA